MTPVITQLSHKLLWRLLFATQRISNHHEIIIWLTGPKVVFHPSRINCISVTNLFTNYIKFNVY